MLCFLNQNQITSNQITIFLIILIFPDVGSELLLAGQTVSLYWFLSAEWSLFPIITLPNHYRVKTVYAFCRHSNSSPLEGTLWDVWRRQGGSAGRTDHCDLTVSSY